MDWVDQPYSCDSTVLDILSQKRKSIIINILSFMTKHKQKQDFLSFVFIFRSILLILLIEFKVIAYKHKPIIPQMAITVHEK